MFCANVIATSKGKNWRVNMSGQAIAVVVVDDGGGRDDDEVLAWVAQR